MSIIKLVPIEVSDNPRHGVKARRKLLWRQTRAQTVQIMHALKDSNDGRLIVDCGTINSAGKLCTRIRMGIRIGATYAPLIATVQTRREHLLLTRASQ